MAFTVSIDFLAEIARLTENTDRAAKGVEDMGARIDSAVGMAKKALGALGISVSVMSFVNAVQGAIDLGDSLNDLSKRTGISVEELGGLQLAADQSGTSVETLAKGLKSMSSTLSENKDIFERFGISTKDQKTAMLQLSDVIANMENPVQRTALAVKAFGKSGAELIPLLMEGSEGIKKMIERGERLSQINASMAAASDQFNDSMAEMKLRTQGLFVGIASQLLPTLNELVTAWNDYSDASESSSVVTDGVVTIFQTVAVVGANVAFVFKGIGREIGGIVAQFSAMGEAGGIFTKAGRDAWSAVGEEIRADAAMAREELDKFEQRIMAPQKLPNVVTEPKDKNLNNKGAGLLTALEGDKDAKLNLEWMRSVAERLAKLQEAAATEVQITDGKYAAMQRTLEVALKSKLITEEEYARLSADVDLKRDAEVAMRDLAWQQGVAQRLAAIQLSNATEEELEQQKFTEIQNTLQFALDTRFITQQQFNALMEQEELRHRARLGNITAQGILASQKFEESSARAKSKTILGEMLALTNGVATHNRALFEINKIAGIANAGINTFEGVALALATYPPPLNFGMAGLVLAAGLAQVSAIQNAQFGSSVSAPSVGGGAAAPVSNTTVQNSGVPPVPKYEEPRKDVSLVFNGSGRYTYEEVVNGIAPLLKEGASNGAVDITVSFSG